jgi:hypothetical protein
MRAKNGGRNYGAGVRFDTMAEVIGDHNGTP